VNANVLLTSAGRRVSLLGTFRKELQQRIPEGLVFAADLNPDLSAACQAADRAFSVPRVTDESYPDALLQICIENSIGLVVPTIDTELRVLSEHRERFADKGIHLIVSDPGVIADCRDKRRTAELFGRQGLGSPEIFSHDSLQFPCFAKPYDGSCSVDIHFLPNEAAVTQDIRDHPTMMFMEYRDLADHDEVTMDLYFDRSHQLRCIVPRLRLEVRSGEVCKAVTRDAPYLEQIQTAFAEIPGARGCLTLQVFVDRRTDGGVYGIEINPRFGGGYPLSYLAGANFPGWLIDEYLFDRRVAFYDDWERDLLMLRYDDEVISRGYSSAT